MPDLEDFKKQFDDFFDATRREIDALKKENEKLKQIIGRSVETWANGRDYTAEGKFMTREQCQTFIDRYQKTRVATEVADFFIDTKCMIDLINKSTNVQGERVVPDMIQVILASNPNLTIVITGAMADGSHVYFKDMVLENVWPDTSAGSPGHASTLIYP